MGAGVLAGVFWSLELVGRARSWVELELESASLAGGRGPTVAGGDVLSYFSFWEKYLGRKGTCGVVLRGFKL